MLFKTEGVSQFACMLELEQALEEILSVMPAPEGEAVRLEAVYGRFAAERVVAPIDLPLFDNSTMDGYALRAADLHGAAGESPVRLRLVGRVPAGSAFTGKVGCGECVRIFTGSPIPPRADAVVMQEDTRTEPAEQEIISVLAEVAPGESIRRKGEDIAKGTTVLEPGEAITAGRLSLLGALGFAELQVGRRPKVGVIATGSELREAGQELLPGQIYESNRLVLSHLVRKAGAEPETFPLVRDTLAETRNALMKAFESCDVVVTSGGVSVGEMDFIKDAFEENGESLQFWKVAIKPGRPFVFGRMGRKFLFGLPGNPVSAFVTFLLLVRPALLRWQGATDVTLPSSTGVLNDALVNEGNRRHFFRVYVSSQGDVRSAGLQASHVLSSLAKANGLVDVHPNSVLSAGATVQILRFD